jgi:fructokinase
LEELESQHGIKKNRVNMKKNFKIAGIGEVLWDQLPQGDVLGGAPANVAYHAGQLGAESYMISAVGKDALGDKIISLLSGKGINLMLNKADHPTGTVKVTLDSKGIPSYIITKEVAWDYIELSEESIKLAKSIDAICFGSLAQRGSISHSSIVKMLNMVPAQAIKIFDINLRQDFYNKNLIEESLKLSNVLKINDDELVVVAKLFGWSGDDEELCMKLLKTYNLRMVAYTCGTRGSYLFTVDKKSFLETPKVIVKDTVGAGDSFTAALMTGLLKREELSVCHKKAVELAAFVCQSEGAMPDYAKMPG